VVVPPAPPLLPLLEARERPPVGNIPLIKLDVSNEREWNDLPPSEEEVGDGVGGGVVVDKRKDAVNSDASGDNVHCACACACVCIDIDGSKDPCFALA